MPAQAVDGRTRDLSRASAPARRSWSEFPAPPLDMPQLGDAQGHSRRRPEYAETIGLDSEDSSRRERQGSNDFVLNPSTVCVNAHTCRP